MDVLADLLPVDSIQTLKFFLFHLEDQVKKERVKGSELLYVASVLTHYAHTSCYDMSETMPTPQTLSDVFDHFILHDSELQDGKLLAIAGAQVLLLVGFFRDQMEGRHTVRWYEEIGQSLYEGAARHSVERKNREFFGRMAQRLPFWTATCRNLSQTLQEERLLLKLN